MITLKKVTLEGFCGLVEEREYLLDMPGINLIWGRNGAGKSTIINAIAWALYGELIKPKRSITPWKSKQTKEYKGTKVTIKLVLPDHKSITVIRCKEYSGKIEGKKGGNGVFLFIGKSYWTEGRNKGDVNKKVESILGVSFDLFKASITFGQNLGRFLKLSSGDQKELMDEAFAINYINEAREQAKKERDKLMVGYSEVKSECTSVLREYKLTKTNLKNITKLKDTFESDKVSDIKSIKGNLKKTKKEIITLIKNKKDLGLKIIIEAAEDDLEKAKEDRALLTSLDNKSFKLDFGIENAKGELEGLKNKRKELMGSLSKPTFNCITCGQPINKEKGEKQRDKIKLDIKTINKQIPILSNNIQRDEKSLASIKLRLVKRKEMDDKYKSIETTLRGLYLERDKLMEIPEKLKALKKIKEGYIIRLRETLNRVFGYNLEKERKSLIALKSKLDEIKGNRADLWKNLSLHNWVINDPLSNKGIKAYIFNLMIQRINQKLYEYGKKVNFGIKLSIDLESANKNFNAEIKSMGQIIPYDDLSGGEEQLVDICLAFAMHDVLANSRFNVLLMDEVFESLDKENIDLVYEIIATKANAVSVHLITHRKSFISRANAVTEL